jgi:acyl-[acyl-carrier-protein]-phospholipid O-acyltransferase/long-chain-fatty-acid--[acyl-carrier-protein] ligase
MDAKTIGELVQTYQATMLISTPTFYGMYLRQCPPEVFRSLRYAIVGAEKLRPALAQAFRDKYEIDLLEGYAVRQVGHKPGTVGHPIPGVSARIVHPETEAPLPYGTAGLLLVHGPSRMLGYLGQPEKTTEVLRHGWYVTGDIAAIDEDGFIRITDRLARFSKIGGEMVPHLAVEEAINTIIGEPACVVTSLPDAQKGERLVALYTRPEMSRETLWEQLNHTELPKLWIPKREHMFVVEAIPTLGTGKVDLQQVKHLASAQMGEPL